MLALTQYTSGYTVLNSGGGEFEKTRCRVFLLDENIDPDLFYHHGDDEVRVIIVERFAPSLDLAITLHFH